MLFDFFRKHTRLLQFVLVLLVFPSFVVFGIQGYSRMTSGENAAVAKVAGRTVTQAEWEVAQREQLQRAQRRNPGVDAKLFDTPQAKQAALDSLVRERVLFAAADDAHFTVSDERLKSLFENDPSFAMLRNPDGSVNKTLLEMQGMSSQMFAQRLRQEYALRQVIQGVASTAFAASSAASAALDPLFQRREVQLQRFDPKDYEAKVAPSDADLKKYYEDPQHAAQFNAPEQANVELITLNVDALRKSVAVSEDDLRAYYKQNLKRYDSPEERHASHILIKAEKNAAKAELEKAKAKAQSLLEQVRKNPASFAEVAKANSEDPGSAERGGDLDFFTKDSMDPRFAEAAFALKPGEISDVVQSDYGFHIIKLAEVRGGKTQPFESVRAQIDDEVRKQLATKKFSELATDFSNTVYEQSDSLKPAADKFKLEIKRVDNVKRTPAPGTVGPTANAKLLAAIFAPDSIKNKRNTDAVEIGANQLVSARVVGYSPARRLSFEEVKDRVRRDVIAEQASALARKAGEARLAELQKDPQSALASAPVTLSRANPMSQSTGVIELAMKVDATKLPAVAGADLGDEGYAIVRVTQVLSRDPAMDTPQVNAQFAQAEGEATLVAYYEALKSRFKVDMKGHTPESVQAAASAASAP